MFTLAEARSFRSLRYVRRPLGAFHVLVGPNASGKTTFLDVIGLLSDLVSEGVDEAIRTRTQNFSDLTWRRAGSRIELAIEALIPDERRNALGDSSFDTVRYEVAIGSHPGSDDLALLAERALLKRSGKAEVDRGLLLFPLEPEIPESIISNPRSDQKTILSKTADGNDTFYQEAGKMGWNLPFRLGPKKSALGNLPEDESKFPVSTWLKALLSEGVQRFVLNSLLIRRASAPAQSRGFNTDGSNLPWVIHELQEKSPERYANWIAHLQTALPDLAGVRTVEREDDRHRYLVLEYANGLSIPSWMASDGTLRLLALTLPAYANGFSGVYLIEEPENGIHPRAVETMFQSLQSVYGAQVLLATHSPVILSIVEPKDVLCFGKTSEGATAIVSGDRHPALREWRGESNLGLLFAAGVLG
jgi:predicted ATPase